MDIAVKQRILGGVVLVAAAILFLPVVLEGAGVKALQPPAPPTPPSTPSTQDLAPALQAQAQTLAKDISASHGEPTFYPVEPAVIEESTPTQATAEQYRLVEPKAATPVRSPVVVAEPPVVAQQSADKSAELAAKASQDAAAKAKLAITEAEKKKAAAAAAEKAAAIKAAKAPVASAEPDPALPQAWVVQVASLSTQAKANAMVEKLRARGYRASVSGAGDSWRVIVGPELDKAVAEAVKRRLAEDPQLKLNGWIQAYRP